MRSFGKLVSILLLSFVFFLSLLCFLCLLRRRRRRPKQPLAGDVELGCKNACFKESKVLSFLCCKIRSRVEPAGDSPVLCSAGGEQVKIPAAAPPPEAEEECAFGPSRVLYTIEEEEEEREDLEIEEKEEDEVFATPCESPAFCTPASSPARSPEKGV